MTGSESESIVKVKILTEGTKPNVPLLAGILLIPLALGTALAFALRTIDNANSYRETITSLVSADKHWTYLAVVVFGRTLTFLNLFPTGFKSHLKGNLRSNPFFYTVRDCTGEKDDNDTIVSFIEDGDIGKYNRANRSIHHMVENFGAFLIGTVLVGDVFPKSVFVLVCIFSLGRVLHQVGYTTRYGGHAAGFLLSIVLANSMMEGFCLLIFLDGVGAVSL
mmetsp:Transcript_15846/g.18238  ORF Transcript_15846/g.18238 Transcript_15846/m.18238 type:complete len:221 (-) Transcript_15846:14-676(-)